MNHVARGWRERGENAGCVPRPLGVGTCFENVNQIVIGGGILRMAGEYVLDQHQRVGCAFYRKALFVVPVWRVDRKKQLGIQIVRILISERFHFAGIIFVPIFFLLLLQGAQVILLVIGGFVEQAFDLFERSFLLLLHGLIVGNALRDTPVGHGGIGIEPGRFLECAVRFEVPEAVQERHALLEILLSRPGSCRDSERGGTDASA